MTATHGHDRASPLPSAITYICCGVLQQEVESLQETGVICGEAVYPESMLHLAPNQLYRKLDRLLHEINTPCILVYGTCCYGIHELAEQTGTPRVDATNCSEMLLGRTRYREMLREGAFFLLPEWAHRWHEVFQKQLGLSRTIAREMMQQSHSVLVYLDTGLAPIPYQELRACTEYLGLPYRVIEVGIDHLANTIVDAADRLPGQSALA